LPCEEIAPPEIYELDSGATCEVGGGAGVNMSGPDVLCIETRLDQVTVGPINFEVDQLFDEHTEIAVMWFQAANGQPGAGARIRPHHLRGARAGARGRARRPFR
jgi:hypothetical protein